MSSLQVALQFVLTRQAQSQKPLAVILAGHNGSGKSTMWYKKGLADKFQIPLVNADRMMLSILPEVSSFTKALPQWAARLRDANQSWMRVAQKGVEAFVARAMAEQVPFAMETVFSHWRVLEDGRIESKIDLIRQMQETRYFVVLFFVGLANYQLSIARVKTRVQEGGHDVDISKLQRRFPRTQEAIKHAAGVADATILVDNSREPKHAFTVCRIQMGGQEIYDYRRLRQRMPKAIREWLDVVSPLNATKSGA